MNEKLESAMPWLFVAGLLLIWQLACVGFSIPNFILPRPSVVAQAFVAQFSAIMENSWDTLVRTVVGFVLAVVLGALLGIAIGSSRLVYRGLYPVLIGFNSVPKVAVVPVFVIWFGTGTVPAILTAFLVSFFPIAVNVATGACDGRAGITRRAALARRAQAANPDQGGTATIASLFLRLAENRDHAGLCRHHHLRDRREQQRHWLFDDGGDRQFRHALVFAGLFVIAALGIIMYALFAVIEQRMTFWAKRGDGLMTG